MLRVPETDAALHAVEDIVDVRCAVVDGMELRVTDAEVDTVGE